MQKISVRLPGDVVAAYDQAKGNRSSIMRRVLSEAVEDGELDGIDHDLVALASAENAKDQARLARKRASFRERMYNQYCEAWQSGTVTPKDARDMYESWEAEATIYGAEYLRFAEAVIRYFSEQWAAAKQARPKWPEPETFMLRSEEIEIEIEDRMIELMREGKERGYTREQAIEHLTRFHPTEQVEAAAKEVYESATKTA